MAVEPEAGAGRTTGEAISDLVASLHVTHYGTRPREVRTYLDERFVVCVLVEPFSGYEKSLANASIGLSELWELYEDSVREKLTAAVSEFTDREVVSFFSRTHQDPDLVVACFALARDSREA